MVSWFCHASGGLAAPCPKGWTPTRGVPKGVGVGGDPDYPEVRTGFTPVRADSRKGCPYMVLLPVRTPPRRSQKKMKKGVDTERKDVVILAALIHL